MMIIIIDYRLNTEIPLDLFQDAEKGLDHNSPHRLTILFNYSVVLLSSRVFILFLF
jgi:hypothetical protein